MTSLRFPMKSLWFQTPTLLLIGTIVAALVGFVLVGLVLASGAGRNVRAFVVGTSGTIASLSAYIGTGVSQSGWIAAGFLILTPAAVLIGLVAGGSLGVFLKTGWRSPAETGT
jgi:hypothetical protein